MTFILEVAAFVWHGVHDGVSLQNKRRPLCSASTEKRMFEQSTVSLFLLPGPVVLLPLFRMIVFTFWELE
jgi:hypothetical protein